MIEPEIPYILQCVDAHIAPKLEEINRSIAAIQNRMPVSPEVVSQLRQELACTNSALERANKRDAERIIEVERLKLELRALQERLNP